MRIKNIKLWKYIGLLLLMLVAYFFSIDQLTSLAGRTIQLDRGMFNTKDILVSGIIYFLGFLSVYFFVYKNKRFAKYKTLQRVILYALFLGFSAAVIFILISPVIQHTRVIRFRDPNMLSTTIALTYLTSIGYAVTYTIFTFTIEVKEKTNQIFRKLLYWFIVSTIAAYCSLTPSLFYTKVYQKECFNPSAPRTDYCREIGETFHYLWKFIPGVTVLILTGVFIVLYFKRLQTKKIIK